MSIHNVAVVGDVDAAKSTFIGVITSGALDDGRGSARTSVLSLKHEHDTGRTSTVNTANVILGNKEIRFLDLAGHEKYLGVTLQGMTRYAPDAAVLMVAANRGVSDITRNHLSIIHGLRLPMIVCISKIDSVPPKEIKRVYDDTMRAIKVFNRRPFTIDTCDTPILTAFHDSGAKICPIVKISLVTGAGLDVVKAALQQIEHLQGDGIPEYMEKEGIKYLFVVQKVYQVDGIGLVFYGANRGAPITAGTSLYLGPYKGKFYSVKARSLHDDRRNTIESLEKNMVGCVGIGSGRDLPPKRFLYKGIVLCEKMVMCRRFTATVTVYNHQTTVKANYRPIVHVFNTAVGCKIVNVLADKRPSGYDPDQSIMRLGDTGTIEVEFFQPQWIYPHAHLLMREGTIKIYGIVTTVS
jgi:elongation factor 1-alpha